MREKYRGLGVSACATCDGFFYRKKRVAVVGGGDTACEEALYLSTLAEKVFLIVRKPFLRASKAMQKKVFERENIQVLFECNTLGLYMEKMALREDISYIAREKLIKRVRSADRWIFPCNRSPSQHRNIPRLARHRCRGLHQCAGSVNAYQCRRSVCGRRLRRPNYRRAISAAGTGCRAAMDAERFLMNHDEH